MFPVTTATLCPLLLVFCFSAFALGQDQRGIPEHIADNDDNRYDTHRRHGMGSQNEPILDRVHAEVEFLTQSFAKHVKNYDCGAFLNMYDPEMIIVNRDGSVLTGLKALQVWVGEMSGIAVVNSTRLAVSALGSNARFVFQHERMTFRDSDGNFLGNEECFVIWKRHHNGLKSYIEMCEPEE